ncbi:Exoskeleton protein RP43 [Lamellibrachia satsuma]|nr:Exoskeleton protein RP43 [Lamellibrachia satsuma]
MCVPESTLRGWLKDEMKLREFIHTVEEDDGLRRKKTHVAKDSALDNAVLNWFVQERQTGLPISATPSQCSKLDVLTGSSGSFGTYGSSYRNNQQCSWRIQVSSKKRVKLHFTKFDIEYSRRRRCPYDKVKIYDGSNANAPLIGTYCGTRKPGDKISKDNTMFVSFTTDRSVTKAGFRIQYSAISPSCGRYQVLSGQEGIFGTSGSKYLDHEWCMWRIKTPHSHMRIRLRFLSFNLEKHSSCKYDRCQLDDTKCQLDDTKCQLDDTKCQLDVTKCQLDDTKCQLDNTKCQLDDTKCQLDDTKCQLDDTKCQQASMCHSCSG